MTPSSMLASTSPIASSGGYAGSGTFCVTRIFGRADVLDMVTSKRNILWLLYHLLVEWCARVGQAWTSRAGTSPRPYPITQWLAKPYRVRARACPRPGSCATCHSLLTALFGHDSCLLWLYVCPVRLG